MSRQAAEVGIQGIDGLNACGEAQCIDGFFQTARLCLQIGPILVHQHHHAGVIALRHAPAVDLGNRGLRIGHHGHGVLVHHADMRVEYLVEEAADFLAPFAAVFLQVRHRLMRVH